MGTAPPKFFQHTDGLGSPIGVTDLSGALQGRRIVYEPYGDQAMSNEGDGPAYTGHVSDSMTTLTYMQARYYDPVASRFLSVDPVAASAESVNRYWYANNNPYKYVDPDGRQSFGLSQAQLSAQRVNSLAASAKAMAGARAGAALSAALPRSTLMEYGGGAAGGGALGGAVQGAVGVLTPNGTPLNAVSGGAYVTGGAMLSAPGGSVSLPSLESGGNQIALGGLLVKVGPWDLLMQWLYLNWWDPPPHIL